MSFVRDLRFGVHSLVGTPGLACAVVLTLALGIGANIAASFVLLAGASALVSTLLSLQAVQTGFDMDHVLAIDVPAMTYGKSPQQVLDFYKENDSPD